MRDLMRFIWDAFAVFGMVVTIALGFIVVLWWIGRQEVRLKK